VTAGNGQQRPSARVQVVVTVGTDHHPFDRLVHWVNDWLRAHPEHTPGFFVQSGTSTAVPACAASPSVEVQRLDQLLDGADVIVCHGGPASIAAAWTRDLLPIVVPRRPDLGEHVDDHQVVFSRKVAQLGHIRLAQTRTEFDDVMAEAIRDPSSLRGAVPAGETEATVARFGELIDELVSQPRRRLRPRRQIPRGLVPAPTATQENTSPNRYRALSKADEEQG
jgi:UDP-N-acetylglucosamine transferase subunit ALG13